MCSIWVQWYIVISFYVWKIILREDGQSAYDVLLSIFDGIIVNKAIHLPIKVESSFKFSIFIAIKFEYFINF